MKATIFVLSTFLHCFGLQTFADAETKPMSEKTLTEQLQEKVDAAKSRAPSEKAKIMDGAIEDLRKSTILAKALKTGDKMPSFSLPDVTKGTVVFDKLLAKGPLVVVFYRGGWCPYCNLQLRDLQKYLKEINGAGAELVAISPQTPDNSLSTAQKSELSFYVLSDADNKVAREFGLVFKLPDNLKEIYKEFGIDLAKSNASKEWELPLGATYIVTKDGKIAYSFLDADYKKRAETKEIVAFLKGLSGAH